MRSGNGHVCHHCFVSTSPCWRKGPEDKPILCNACGARYLVKRSLVGYFPHARPQAPKKDGQARQKGGHSGRPAAGQAKVAAADGKRKRKAGREPGSPSSRNEDVTFVDRGTQTVPHVPLFLPTGPPQQQRTVVLPGPPSLFTLSPTKRVKVLSEEDFTSFAVSALTLPRQSESASDSAEDGTSTQTVVVRRPRKPANTIRALF